MLAGPVPVPVILTLSSGRDAVVAKVRLTQREASAISFRVGACHPVGRTVVCRFSMRMRGGATCAGRVQIRVNRGDVEGRYVGVVCK